MRAEEKIAYFEVWRNATNCHCCSYVNSQLHLRKNSRYHKHTSTLQSAVQVGLFVLRKTRQCVGPQTHAHVPTHQLPYKIDIEHGVRAKFISCMTTRIVISTLFDQLPSGTKIQYVLHLTLEGS